MLEIPQQEYATRRQRLMAALPADSAVLLIAPPEVLRNGDSHYPYRPDSNFYYLTGIAEPDVLAILRHDQFIVFNHQLDVAQERWIGKRLNQTSACDVYGAHAAYPLKEIKQRLPELLQHCKTLYYSFLQRHLLEQHLQRIETDPKFTVEAFHKLEPKIAELRLRKSPTEMALMRHAAQVSAQGHIRAMQACRPGLYEYQLEAELLHTFMQHGCRHVAYPAIVGSGVNACILHYTENRKLIQEDELVLIDAACEAQYYAADITRTFPSNGKFNGVQRDLYQVVLQAQLAGIAQVKPGNTWGSIQQAIIQTLTSGLVDLGILQGDKAALLKERAYQPFYMHNSGHWLGLDVHDAGSYRVNNQSRRLEPGMVLTVEPGLYLDATYTAITAPWQNIGIRIEDDILITDGEPEVLSDSAPKTIDAIETLMASA